MYKLLDGDYMLLGQNGIGHRITPEFAKQLSNGEVAYKDITKNLHPLVYKTISKKEDGGKIDFNKVNAFARGGKVVKAAGGMNLDTSRLWTGLFEQSLGAMDYGSMA